MSKKQRNAVKAASAALYRDACLRTELQRRTRGMKPRGALAKPSIFLSGSRRRCADGQWK